MRVVVEEEESRDRSMQIKPQKLIWVHKQTDSLTGQDRTDSSNIYKDSPIWHTYGMRRKEVYS